jgi:hypothetical protein
MEVISKHAQGLFINEYLLPASKGRDGVVAFLDDTV